jgi:hypothetical protein
MAIRKIKARSSTFGGLSWWAGLDFLWHRISINTVTNTNLLNRGVKWQSRQNTMLSAIVSDWKSLKGDNSSEADRQGEAG